MDALRTAMHRLLNPPPRQEAVVVQRQAERLKAAAAELAEHHDVFADLVRSVRRGQTSSKKRRKTARPQ